MTARFGSTELPEAQERCLRRAVRLQWVSILFLVSATVLVYVVLGNSQAMKAAWIEDLLSFAPPLAFLIAVRVSKRLPSRRHPYGLHRSIGVAHLVAAVALVAMGGYLVVDSGMKLLTAEHPPIGVVELFGTTVWLGWLMIAAMAYTAVPPVILGRLKMQLADELHDKVLYADAKMNKADWMTAVAAMVGVFGIGLGLWWADAVAALLISGSILHDGVRNVRGAVRGLMDARATTYDDAQPHPLTDRIDELVAGLPWVGQARSRVRDEGHVFHVEVFAVPHPGVSPTMDELEQARRAIDELDWKLHDVVVVPVTRLPTELLA
ncbi:cation diffusion facilitator family transporter [Pseudonocardia humida]|uniref:Cation transporter n=1 Tax=Pseudonocardia humida TaxID=2800819 RepID=A0ABT1A9S4_9PSEU|nr:cation diffusion facilitator family transporter [Pseudonocardia humida]MCO1659785.1 cation transporter [Pseudonocardia humida]